MSINNVYIEHFLLVHDIELIVYIATLFAAIIFIYGLYRRYKRIFPNGGFPEFNHIGVRIKRLIIYSLFQKKVLYRGYEGIMHLLIFVGFIILFIGTLLRAFEADIMIKLFNIRVIYGDFYLIFKLILNIAGSLAIIGIILAFIRRLFFKSKYVPNTVSDHLILLDLLIILLTGFILDAGATYYYRFEWINGWDFIGYNIVNLFGGEWILSNYRYIWILHMLLAVFSIALIPYTKLYHIIIGGILNIFFSRLEHPSAFKHIPNIDEIVEKGGIPGSNKLIDFTWKERMDYDSCIKCARCTDNCPATASDKPLNPMDLILLIRGVMDTGKYEDLLVPNYIEKDIIWSCVTCGACVYQCPMMIHHVETILDIRRYLLGSGENVPEELMQVSYNLMRYGNPLAFNPMEREKFVKQLVEETGVEIASEDVEYDYIYWLGCNTSYDPNAKPIAIALLKVLKQAGLKIGILAEEQCCGEPARRIGDELMFKELVKMNKELLSKYRFKALLVNCPHGYNIFKHEYPMYGFNVNVEHHSKLLYKLIKEGKLELKKDDFGKITYHDPCYLGRWNLILDEPRFIINSVSRNSLFELRNSREKSFCCGGGGGHLFFELKKGERIGKVRMREIMDANVNTVVVACPICKIMLKSEAPDELNILDISELLIKE